MALDTDDYGAINDRLAELEADDWPRELPEYVEEFNQWWFDNTLPAWMKSMLPLREEDLADAA